MPPRRGRQPSRRRQPAEVEAPWASLPAELVQGILAHLTLMERHRAAVRVSKQWHAACYAPALLQNLHIGDELQYEEVERWSLERLAAYCAWLARRRPAQHARSVVLRLLLPTSGRYEPHIPQLSDAGLQEREYLAACLAAIGSTAGSQLRALELSADCAQLSTGAWPAGLTALTSLALDNHSGTMWLSPALRGLTGLEELWLRASDGMEGEANLPPGVTRLLWEETRGLDLPESLSTLRCLRHLIVSGWNMEGHCFDALTGVTSLAHLRLDEAAVLPDSLHQLTWLRSLHISALERMEGGLMVGLEQALPALQRLTALALMGVPPWRPGLMGALGGLPRLQRLAVCHEWEGYGGRSGRGTLPPADLAAPACLSRLTTLGMDGDLLLRNPHLLEAAAQLQHLWLMGRGMRRAGYGRPWRRFKAWAQQHTPLRSLSLSPSYNSLGYVPSDIAAYQWRDLLALQRQRPGLVLHDWDSDASEDVLWQPFFAEAA